MARAKIQIIRNIAAELEANGMVWQIGVNLVINSSQSVMREEPVELVNVPDGIYELRYVFGGRMEGKSVRVERGDILGNA